MFDFFIYQEYLVATSYLVENEKDDCLSPCIYLFRHTVELGLKYINDHITEENRGLMIHDLSKLRSYLEKDRYILCFTKEQEKILKDKLSSVSNKKLQEKLFKKLKTLDLGGVFSEMVKRYSFDEKNTRFRYAHDPLENKEYGITKSKMLVDLEILEQLALYIFISIQDSFERMKD